jgi:regulatory protein
MNRGSAGGPASERSRSAADPTAHAREICLRQLATRPRGRAELAGKLRRDGVAEDVIDAVLDRLTEAGLIDDQAFASMVVSSARNSRSLGRRGLAHELRRRGVDPVVSADAIAVIDDEAEEASARALVAKRLPGLASLPAPVRARRLNALLARKGFSAELAKSVLRSMLADLEAEDDFSAADTDAWPDSTD